MTITISGAQLWQLAEESDNNAQRVGTYDWIAEYPSQLGTGYRQNIALRNEIYLTLHNYTFHDDLLVQDFDCPDIGDFEFVFNLSSSFRHYDGYEVNAGQNFLIRRFTAPNIKWLHWQREPVLEVDIHVDAAVLKSFVTDHLEVDSELDELFEEKHGRLFQPQITTPTMHSALLQILNCPYRGITRQIYLEGKALELIALQLELTTNQLKSRVAVKLCRDDVDRIHYAKDILARSLDNPPSILELARQVGMSESKLHRGFRYVLGTTPFGYLRNYRLEQGRTLLEVGEMTVQEVAHAVGYASQSRFCDAFKQKFGTTPMSCRRGHRPTDGKHWTSATHQ